MQLYRYQIASLVLETLSPEARAMRETGIHCPYALAVRLDFRCEVRVSDSIEMAM